MARYRCDKCGGPYYTRNYYEVWTTQGPRGHRVRTIRRICTTCQPQTETRRALIGAESRVLSVREVNKIRKQITG
jgi:hypothetical protein